MTTDWVRQMRGVPRRRELIEPEPCPLPAAAGALEPYGGTQSDDKLPKALFPVFVQRVALLCCRNCYLAVIAQDSPSPPVGSRPVETGLAPEQYVVRSAVGLANCETVAT